VEHHERAVSLWPDSPELHSNLGLALTAIGRHADAESAFRRALALRPDFAGAHSNLILSLDLNPDATRASIFGGKRRYNAWHARALTAVAPPHTNDRDPDRPLRIGYVGADFRYHAAAVLFAGIVFQIENLKIRSN
jgi:tetratricopeptide (TPR) repeat protein